ncbi:5-oxoprolinase subunit C family protein [Oryzibacter oryziterrae]|uniref:5-oxoprolinase subunit C family protein n=1 Tax=Oryzibacter oryziterrae TaxID=2766474 RepID=UPI001F2ED27E|nr:biotin-dependent carboxyltransferase family protein [Oryzibacter oryziterrae]
MSTVDILSAGPMLTVQDLGRPGFLASGVSAAGPMDPPSLRIANALVGNEAGAAALEFAHVGGRFQFGDKCRIAVTGGDVDIRRDGVRLYPWESHEILPGQMLVVGGLRSAVWGYLAISGGIDVPPVLGSRSTHLRTGLGGHEGRRLQAGDRLPLGQATDAPLLCPSLPWLPISGPVRVVAGPQADYFADEVLQLFTRSRFTVSSQRDRMAQVLEGPALSAQRGHDIVSDGTCMGSIQVPASGRPIVLMAERQTTGGYPKIATVISADVPRLAQMPSGQRLRFVTIEQDAAEDVLIANEAALQDLLGTLVESAK